jgi:hypothetical protein
MSCGNTLRSILKDEGDKFIIKYADWKRVIGNNQFNNEKCYNDSDKPIHVQKENGPVLAIKADKSFTWVKQQIPNGISLDSEGGRKSRRHKRKTLKRKTKRRRYKHRRSRRTRR